MARKKMDSVKEQSSGTGKGWFKPGVFRISFKELGYSQFWVEIIEPGSYLYGDTVRYESLNPDSDRHEIEVELARLIANWNLTDPTTGESLPLPTAEDTTPLYRLPLMFIGAMQEAVGLRLQQFAEEGALKKASEMRPEAISEVFKAQGPQDG